MLLDIQAVLPAPTSVELVERKGIGHPDTLADRLAEQVSVQLSRYYMEHFGAVLHHNVDKVLICAGASRPAFGGGEIVEPIDVYLAGRATASVKGIRVPVDELAVQSTTDWLRASMPQLEVGRDIRVHCRIRPGSSDLTELFGRSGHAAPLANDSSVGVGFAPLTPLERAVLEFERRLNSASFRGSHPEAGLDVKLMGQRYGSSVTLTVARAFIGSSLSCMAHYLEAKQAVTALARVSSGEWGLPLTCVVNAGDQPEVGSIYLTVSGSSVEAGDDGEVGRGNRVNGLITPQRPMSLEAVAGKNPVNHTGKLYNVLASEIAQTLTAQLPGARGVTCYLASQIGRPINDPCVAQVVVESEVPGEVSSQAKQVRAIVHEHLDSYADLTRRLVNAMVPLF